MRHSSLSANKPKAQVEATTVETAAASAADAEQKLELGISQPSIPSLQSETANPLRNAS